MPRPMTVFGALLLLLTIILYVGTVANLTTMHDSGRGRLESRRAQAGRGGTPAESFSAMVERVEPYLPTMQWLVDQHCDCDAELAALEATVRIYPDSPERSRFLSALIRIRLPR
jgi:hypothetical protein